MYRHRVGSQFGARRRWLSMLALLLLMSSACEGLVSVEVRDIDLQPVESFAQSFVYASDGSLIATLRFNNREPVAYEDLPQGLIDAVVSAEDRRFFQHPGVDPRAVVRAWVANRQAGGVVQGGSTITQQLIKTRYFPDAELTLERKSAEARLAWELEQEATKVEILTDYLNTIYLGSGAYGIEAAAQTYFDTTTSALTTDQSALLAGIIRSPETFSPFNNPEGAVAERQRVLRAMAQEGYLTAQERDALDQAPLVLAPPPQPPETRYPFFVEYVKRQLVADEHFGVTEEARWRRLFGGGLRIYTTIDPALQATAERAATAFWAGPEDPEVAISVVDPETGHMVASVGGRDFGANQFDLATQGQRQPGSTFKVFALTAALSRGWRLDDTIESGSGAFEIGDPEPWEVRSGTEGELTLRDALVQSSNGAFARLALAIGPGTVENMARSMGVTSDIGSNPSIVLGGLRTGVSPLDMASAFGTLSNGGVLARPTAVTHITDAEGTTVWEPRGLPTVAVDPETAWLVTDAMQQVITEGTGQAAQLGDRPAAGKTGTVQENRDAWFVGFTREYSTAVWVGYPDVARPLVDIHGVARVQGGNWPARIWQRFMADALAGSAPQPLRYPFELAETVQIDPETGGIATPYCPVTEPFTGLPAELPTYSCPLHTVPLPPRPTSTPSPDPSASATPGGPATVPLTPASPATVAPIAPGLTTPGAPPPPPPTVQPGTPVQPQPADPQPTDPATDEAQPTDSQPTSPSNPTITRDE